MQKTLYFILLFLQNPSLEILRVRQKGLPFTERPNHLSYFFSTNSSNSSSSSSSRMFTGVEYELAPIPNDSRIFVAISFLILGFSLKNCFAFSRP